MAYYHLFALNEDNQLILRSHALNIHTEHKILSFNNNVLYQVAKNGLLNDNLDVIDKIILAKSVTLLI